MKRFGRALSLLAIIAGQLLSSATAQAQEPVPVARWSLANDLTPPAHVVKLILKKKVGNDLNDVRMPFLVTPSLEDPKSYELRAKTGEVEDVVAVTPIADGLGDNAVEDEKGKAGSVKFLLGNYVPSADTEYSLLVKAGAIEVSVDGKMSTLSEQTLKLNPNDLKINEAFLKPMNVQRKLEVDGGTGGGIGQARLDYGINRLGNLDWLNLQLHGTADFNFQASQRDKYFNSLTGELKFFDAFLWDIFGLVKQGRFVELDAHGSVESDQTADNADALGGIRASIYTKDPISGFLSTLFVPKREFILPDGKKTLLPVEAVVSPLITFACDYVSEVANDPNSPGGGSKPLTSGGNARLDAGFYWSMPLARGLTVQNTNVPPAVAAIASLFSGPFGGNAPDIDALFELHGWYDAAAEEFLDQSQISVVFSRRTPSNVKTSIALTWARGKAPPTFNEISALFAGLRLAF